MSTIEMTGIFSGHQASHPVMGYEGHLIPRPGLVGQVRGEREGALLVDETTRLGPQAPTVVSVKAALVGTPDYSLPERYGNGPEIDRLADVWAFGMLLHRLVCGPELPMPSIRQLAPPSDFHEEIQGQDAQVATVESCDASCSPSVLPMAPPTATSLPRTRKHTILCLTSDSSEADGSIQLGRQASAIRNELERSCARGQFEVVTQLAAEPMDLLRVLRKLKPTVVYFVSSGLETTESRPGQVLAGDRFEGLFFRGRGGRPQFLSPSSVEETFGAAGQSVRLVVLSGCYVDLQAEALLRHVDCVVGTRGTVQPEATQAYAVGFMGAIGDHESVAAAHKQACAAINLEGLGGGEPPQMKVRPGVDASKLVLAGRP